MAPFLYREFRGLRPGRRNEAVGDADAVKSTAMGMKNLQRVEKC